MNNIIVALISTVGAILGSCVTGHYVLKAQRNQRQEEIKTENIKFLLSHVYGPMKRIFERSYAEQLQELDQESGITVDEFNEIYKIVDQYFYLMSKDLYDLIWNEKANSIYIEKEKNIHEAMGDNKMSAEDILCHDQDGKIYDVLSREFKKCRSYLGINEKIY